MRRTRRQRHIGFFEWIMKYREKLKLGPGFTLVELLVVIAIIGILATLAMVSYTGAQRQARDTERKSDIKQYQIALEAYSAKNMGTYPVASGYHSVTEYCVDLEMDSCPDDPKTEQDYLYTSDGTTFTLTASMENKEVDWVASSDGTTEEVAHTTVATATPVATATATARPTATPTVRPTTTPTATACVGCYESLGVCHSGEEQNYCGHSGTTCVDCSAIGRYEGDVYECRSAECQRPSTGEPL